MGADQIVNFDMGRAVEQAQRGEPDVLTDIMRQHNRRMFRIARAILRNDAEAEDIVQDAFVKAFTELRSLREPSSAAAWLAKITANLATPGPLAEKQRGIVAPMVNGGQARQHGNSRTHGTRKDMGECAACENASTDTTLSRSLRYASARHVVEETEHPWVCSDGEVRPHLDKHVRSDLEEHLTAVRSQRPLRQALPKGRGRARPLKDKQRFASRPPPVSCH